jgi:hypothetical protein
MKVEDLYKLLQQSTVKLGDDNGTGFFIAPDGWILTCAHVVGENACVNDSIKVSYLSEGNNQGFNARIKFIIQIPVDIAVLKIDGKAPKHQCVYLDNSLPKRGDKLSIFGYPQSYGSEAYSGGDSATIEYEGESYQDDVLVLKLKGGQIQGGFSGSPLLNIRTGKVCGIITISRNMESDLGGRATPSYTLFQPTYNQNLLALILNKNLEYHQKLDKTWNKIVNQFYWNRNIALLLCLFSLICFFAIWKNEIEEQFILSFFRLILSCTIGFSALLFSTSLTSSLLKKYQLFLNLLAGFFTTVAIFFTSLLIIPDNGLIIVRNLTGINEYSTLGMVEEKFPSLLKEIMQIKSEPIIQKNSIYKAIQEFKDETGNGSLISKTYANPGCGTSYRFSKKGITEIIDKSSDFLSSEGEEKINKTFTKESESEGKKYQKASGEFNYTSATLPISLTSKSAPWTTFLPINNVGHREEIGDRSLLQFPSLLEVKQKAKFIDKSSTKSDIWIQKIIDSNLNHRGILAFAYKYFTGTIQQTNDLPHNRGITRFAAVPYVRFVDLQNTGNSLLKIDSIRVKNLNKDMYVLTPILDRNKIFQEVISSDQPINISIPPKQHLFIPVEFGLDTRTIKNLNTDMPYQPHSDYKVVSENNPLSLIGKKVLIAKANAPIGDNSSTFYSGSFEANKEYLMESVEFSSEFIRNSEKPKLLYSKVPDRFAIGSFNNIVSVNANNSIIKIDNPLQEPSFSLSIYMAYGGC